MTWTETKRELDIWESIPQNKMPESYTESEQLAYMKGMLHEKEKQSEFRKRLEEAGILVRK